MNFLACEGDWLVSAEGVPTCNGSLVSLTQQEMQDLNGSALTWDQVSELQSQTIILFATVFAFLILKKLLK
ncbi:hypothetical protein [Pseudomonas sp. RL_15y_Pfl2_60]|uniref:hypothetical protein n=1 Tax=Pseudomonas sp. RL_15y_Pfl2_60 TaxID=3088709 RepID=UPI0030DD4C70